MPPENVGKKVLFKLSLNFSPWLYQNKISLHYYASHMNAQFMVASTSEGWNIAESIQDCFAIWRKKESQYCGKSAKHLVPWPRLEQGNVNPKDPATLCARWRMDAMESHFLAEHGCVSVSDLLWLKTIPCMECLRPVLCVAKLSNYLGTNEKMIWRWSSSVIKLNRRGLIWEWGEGDEDKTSTW